MIDRMARIRAGFCTTRACGPDGIYELKIKFQSLDDLDAADQELRDALEREKAHEGPLVGEQVPVDESTEPQQQSGETVALIVGAMTKESNAQRGFEALMPEPVGRVHHYAANYTPRIEWFRRPGDVRTPLFTADQMREAIRAATERAAKICEDRANMLSQQWRAGHKSDQHLEGQSDGAFDCVDAIRGAK